MDTQYASKNIENSSQPIHEESTDISEDSRSNDALSTPAAPNGGVQAWMQVLGSWVLFLNTWGIMNTFGVFQTYYESGSRFSASSSEVSLIGSIQALTVLLFGALAGPVYDRGGFRWLIIIGSLGVVSGHMLLSIAHTYWATLLTQGLLIGTSAGLLYVPAVAIMPTYFSTKIGLAMGLSASGSSIGGIIYPIMFSRLIEEVGFGWSVRIMGFTTFATLLIPIAVMKQRVPSGKVRSIVDLTAFSDLPYMMFVVGCLIGFTGLYITFFYISYFGEATGITDENLSFYLVPILNAGSVFGRIGLPWLSDKVGLLNVFAPSALIVGLLLLCNIAVDSVGGIVVITLLLGCFTGVFVALPPAIFVSLTEDKSKVGTRIGMGLAIAGLGTLAAGPGGGAILEASGEALEWTSLWSYAGVMSMSGGIIYSILRVYKGGFKVMVKI